MTERLYLQERLGQITTLLEEQGRVSVSDLSERFGVSAVTIRNDLASLEHQGRLLRTHGGAVPRPSPGLEPPAFALRKELHVAEKERIGREAAALVRDGDAIALDASTTAWQVARHLKDRRELTVVTNGLFIALEFVESPGVTVVMPGGSLRAASASLVGDEGLCILDRYHVQKGFFGADGLDDDVMLKNPDAEGLFVTTPFLPDKAGPRAQIFIKAYQKKHGIDPNWFAANTYDAVGMAAEAIKAVGMDRLKVRDYLAAINSKEKAYNGVAGKTYFDENGDCLKDAFVKEIKAGKWVSAEKQLQ